MATSDSSLSSGDDASFGVVSGSARAVITAADFEESADDAPENAYLRARRESPRQRSRRNVPVSSPSPSPSARRRSRGRLSSSPTREGTNLEVDDDAPSAEVDEDAASPIATTAFPARLRVVAPDEEDDPDVPKRGAHPPDASGAVARAVRSLERRGESAPESTATTSRPHPAPAVGASRATSVDDPPRTSTRDPSEKMRARRRSGQTSDTRAPVSSSASSPPARCGASAFAPKNTASVSASADAAVSAEDSAAARAVSATEDRNSAELLLRVAALERRATDSDARVDEYRAAAVAAVARADALDARLRETRDELARVASFSRRERRDDDDDVRRDVRLRASLSVHAERADALEAEQREIRVTLASVVSAAEALRERADARDDEDEKAEKVRGAEKAASERALRDALDRRLDAERERRVEEQNTFAETLNAAVASLTAKAAETASEAFRRVEAELAASSASVARMTKKTSRAVRRAAEVDSVVGSLESVVKSLERRAEEIRSDIKTTEQRVSEDRAVLKAAESARVDARNAFETAENASKTASTLRAAFTVLNDATRDAEARHTSRLARVETAVADAVDAVAEQLTAFKSETRAAFMATRRCAERAETNVRRGEHAAVAASTSAADACEAANAAQKRVSIVAASFETARANALEAADAARDASRNAAAAARHARESRDVAKDARRLARAAISDGVAFADAMRTSIEEADREANAAKDAATRSTYAGVERARDAARLVENALGSVRDASLDAREEMRRVLDAERSRVRDALAAAEADRASAADALRRAEDVRAAVEAFAAETHRETKKRVETAEARLADVDARRFESERALRVSHAAVARVTEAAAVALERREGFASPSTSPAATSPSNAIASPMLRHLEIERRQRVAFRVQEGVVAEEDVAAEGSSARGNLGAPSGTFASPSAGKSPSADAPARQLRRVSLALRAKSGEVEALRAELAEARGGLGSGFVPETVVPETVVPEPAGEDARKDANEEQDESEEYSAEGSELAPDESENFAGRNDSERFGTIPAARTNVHPAEPAGSIGQSTPRARVDSHRGSPFSSGSGSASAFATPSPTAFGSPAAASSARATAAKERASATAKRLAAEVAAWEDGGDASSVDSRERRRRGEARG